MCLRHGAPIFLAHVTLAVAGRNLPPGHPKERDAKDGIVPKKVNADTRESLIKTWLGQVENGSDHGTIGPWDHGHHNATMLVVISHDMP